MQLGDDTCAGHAYGVANGTINATVATGGVSVDLAPTAGDVQTFVAGTGTNLANLFSAVAGAAGGGVIDFSHGGTDTVEFHDTQGSGFAIDATGNKNYNQVLGFTAANDSINISQSHPGIATVNTDGTAITPLPQAGSAFNYSTGTSVSAAGFHDNFIDITTPITSTAAEIAQTAFGDAIGTAVGNGIAVNGAAGSVLVSFYDNTTGDAVLAVAAPAAPAITNATPITVVGLIHESAADYGHIASSLHFVA